LSGAFWALEKKLAESRHFPSVNWKKSYSLYENGLKPVFREMLGEQWEKGAAFLKMMLEREAELLSLVQIVGRDALSEQDKWDLELGEIIRIGFLQQNAFDPVDAFCSLEKQKVFARTLLDLHKMVSERVEKGLLHYQVQKMGLLRAFLSLRKLTASELEQGSSRWLEQISCGLDDREVSDQ
jgi:V/A-type H+-transporting ATPase subunit A